jgi:transketolase
MKIYQNRGNRPTRTGFGEGVLEAAGSDPRVTVIGADITASVGMDFFAEKFPGRFISLGIAEQNCTAVAAGLALEGKIPVFSTYGVFAAHRAADQLRISVCYNHLHVVIGGAHTGVSVGPDGATHQALEDMAYIRALPNITLFSPCDATQARKATLAAIRECTGPVYIRFGREPMPDFTDEDAPFKPGKAELLMEGTDATLIATGHLVWEALKAAYLLRSLGTSVRVLNIHTVKPIDREAIILAACETGLIVTAEEHQVTGGLGSAVTEVVSDSHPCRVFRTGMPDRFGESGKPFELMRKFGMTSDALVPLILNTLKSGIPG